jgi:SAM-dependent methyltransferase
MPTDPHGHWEDVYKRKSAETVSWYRPHLDRSLAWIDAAQLRPDDPIIDVGGGASTLVDDLLERGYRAVTVLDVSETALAQARARLGDRSVTVQWLSADVVQAQLPVAHYALWHDRAVFHFLTDLETRRCYVAKAREAVKPHGWLIVATFALDGPERCSGLPVQRFDVAALEREFGAGFERVDSASEIHFTPGNVPQSFVYVRLRRTSEAT